MIAILKRELKSFFITPIFYIFITMFLALSAFFFHISGIIQVQVADISRFFVNLPFILVFLVPILTMRSIAEEKKSKTDQLLFTAPVATWEIVTAKYLAAVFVLVITMLSTIIFPIILFIYGNPELVPIISQYVGFIFYGAALIAIGIYISSLTENQFIAAIVSFGVLFVLSFIDMLGVWSGNLAFARFIGFISLQNRFSEFPQSILNPASILYFILISVVFLFLTIQRLDRKRVA